jgi:NDP-4-keto-2,6-dideoxyhexose 3-C-methyltransferase
LNCRAYGHATAPVLDLGDQRLPDFTEPGQPLSPAYPLAMVLCPVCSLLQLSTAPARGLLYHARYGFKSGVNEAVRADLGSVVRCALDAVPHPQRWLDIACNDGTLLAQVPTHIDRTGIDPLGQFAGEAAQHGTIITDYFHSQYFAPGAFDVITSVSMFYDLEDPTGFAADVAKVLSTHGAWVIQQNYAGDMLTSNAVDNICHEHVTYFTLRALQMVLFRAGLDINEVTYSPVNGGCIRTLVSHRGRRPIGDSVYRALKAEETAGMGTVATWAAWGESVRRELGILHTFLEAAAPDVWLYGASTRGGTFLQMIDAGPQLLPYAVERSPAKVGKIMAATGIPIISEAQMRADPPRYLLVSPWFFRDVFLRRERKFLDNGGGMVFPLPHFEVIRGEPGVDHPDRHPGTPGRAASAPAGRPAPPG